MPPDHSPEEPQPQIAAAPWRPKSLSGRFLVAGGLLMFLAMAVAGYLIAEIVARDAQQNRAAATALFVQSLVGPLTVELQDGGRLSPEAIAALRRLHDDAAFARRFPHLEIWSPDGAVVYSNSPSLIGQSFPQPPALQRALAGEIAASQSDLSAREHTLRNFGTRYLEIYSPLREQGSGRIIGVAEIHENTTVLDAETVRLRLAAWAAVALATAMIMLGLYGIVDRGSRTIDAQRQALTTRVAEAEALLALNQQLRQRIQRASARVSELNEHYIRSIGADLHDGPAQLLGYAALKLHSLRSAKTAAQREQDGAQIEAVLGEAIDEIRAISRGLVLPDLAALPLPQVLERAVRAHKARSATSVTLTSSGEAAEFPLAIKICVFRFVQEGLNNAYRHSGGLGQRVESVIDAKNLLVRVRDAGREEACPDNGDQNANGLGLHGLRERVESLGGTLSMTRMPEGGHILEMTIDRHWKPDAVDGEPA